MRTKRTFIFYSIDNYLRMMKNICETHDYLRKSCNFTAERSCRERPKVIPKYEKHYRCKRNVYTVYIRCESDRQYGYVESERYGMFQLCADGRGASHRLIARRENIGERR